MNNEITVIINREHRLRLPMIPSFIRDSQDNAISLADLSDEQLVEIGKQWTQALIHKAHVKRQESKAI